jgi:MoaA/NifB/PqqE/SkfB family radical SAM enzyme
MDMPWETAKKLIDEASDNSFPWNIKHITLSENGEAIYNPDFLKIARYTRNKFPSAIISSLSNFGMMTKSLSAAIIQEKLLDTMTINIDGHDSTSYKAVKGISFRSVLRNFKNFMKLRARYYPELKVKINVMPAAEYTLTVTTVLGHLPEQVKNNVPYSDLSLVKDMLSKHIDIKNDLYLDISKSKSGFWAERNLLRNKIVKSPVDQSKLNCPLLDRVKSQAFIAPNGDWYACCLDDNNDLVLGNVNSQSLVDIHNSQVRKEFINKLENHMFEEIGYPCNTVVCCESFSITEYEKAASPYKTLGYIPIKPI